MSLVLRHSSMRPFKLDRHRVYNLPHYYAQKPSGLWLSVDWQWYSFCQAAEFRLPCFRHNYRVRINWDRILCLRTEDDANLFIKNYEREVQPCRAVTVFIDWPKLMQDYDGIYYNCEIGNLDVFSYWDVSSVCVWNMEAVADVLDCEPPEDSKEEENET